MLVLSRRVNERLLIPCIGAAIEVVSVRPGGAVRLGIEAPPEVVVLRAEVAPRSEPPAAPAARPPLRRLLLDRLNNLSLGLALVRLNAGGENEEELLDTADDLERQLGELRQGIAALLGEGGGERAPAAELRPA